MITSGERASPEIALLLHCARAATESDDDDRAEISKLARAVNRWDSFFTLTSRHAIVPLVHQRLARAAPESVPAEIIASIRTAAEQSAMRSLRLAGDLVTVSNALSGAAIDTIAFKGPTLATLLNGNLSLRQFEDLDILVHPDDVRRARYVLLELGYAAVLPFNEDQRASLQLSGHHEQLVHGETATTVELHWNLNNRSQTRDSFEHHWWENRQQVSIGGVAMQTLGVEQLLLYLCMHGGKHSWGRLSWLCDFQRALIRYPTANWSNVWALAAENGTVRMVGIGLKLVESLYADTTNTRAADAGKLDDTNVDEVSGVLAGRLLDAEATVPSLDFSVQIQSRERRRDQLRYTWHVLVEPHPADVSVMGLPRALHGMYFILRPLRLTFKYLGRRLRPIHTSPLRNETD